MEKERTKCEVWARCVGYIRMTSDFNAGKREEYNNRKVFKIKEEE